MIAFQSIDCDVFMKGRWQQSDLGKAELLTGSKQQLEWHLGRLSKSGWQFSKEENPFFLGVSVFSLVRWSGSHTNPVRHHLNFLTRWASLQGHREFALLSKKADSI